jgi:hypothetical protein
MLKLITQLTTTLPCKMLLKLFLSFAPYLNAPKRPSDCLDGSFFLVDVGKIRELQWNWIESLPQCKVSITARACDFG